MSLLDHEVVGITLSNSCRHDTKNTAEWLTELPHIQIPTATAPSVTDVVDVYLVHTAKNHAQTWGTIEFIYTMGRPAMALDDHLIRHVVGS